LFVASVSFAARTMLAIAPISSISKPPYLLDQSGFRKDAGLSPVRQRENPSASLGG
jgi:hypothetical protein